MHQLEDYKLASRNRQEESQSVELEDGELSDEDVEMHCTWGSDCRLRHSGSSDMGNYVMFEPVNLPVPPDMYGTCMGALSPDAGWKHETERKGSFDRSRKHKDGGRLAKCEDNEQSLMELNDLDTDPYYTHHEQTEERSPPRSSMDCPNHPPSPYHSSLTRWRGCNMLDWQSSSRSSSSSSPDYSSTTNSMSSSSPTAMCSANPLKRKLYRKQRGCRWNTYLSSDSDSSSYRSSTPSSEQSYSSLDVDMDSINSNYPNSMRKTKADAAPPSKSRKTL
ncbi:uncharacterized protein LOC115562972 [Drosophila navojoa]|uniref:uncharacterized protein LOC115562972 n=1 Tax=Drosophila navojoa TaxID=7232 RepID=UPI0011BF26F6|nr:uncharacterized protein LOC115562972 [Drosophila navojoa]